MAEARPPRGILDTSVVIDLESIQARSLANEAAITALTMAELAAEPHAAASSDERARRQDRLGRTAESAQRSPLLAVRREARERST